MAKAHGAQHQVAANQRTTNCHHSSHHQIVVGAGTGEVQAFIRAYRQQALLSAVLQLKGEVRHQQILVIEQTLDCFTEGVAGGHQVAEQVHVAVMTIAAHGQAKAGILGLGEGTAEQRIKLLDADKVVGRTDCVGINARLFEQRLNIEAPFQGNFQ